MCLLWKCLLEVKFGMCMVDFEIELHFCPSRKCSFPQISQWLRFKMRHFACQDALLFLLCLSKDGSIENEILVSDTSLPPSRLFHFFTSDRKESRGNYESIFNLKSHSIQNKISSLRNQSCLWLWISTGINNSFCNLRFPGPVLPGSYLEVCLPLQFAPATVLSVYCA